MAENKRTYRDNALYWYVGPGHQLGIKTGDVVRYYGQHLHGPQEVFLEGGLLAHVSDSDIGPEAPHFGAKMPEGLPLMLVPQ